jgi:hypothetical protein
VLPFPCYKPPLAVPRRRLSISIVALAACNGGSKQAEPAAPTPIEVRDEQGVVAELMPIRPCRAKVGDQEMIVGGPPILSQLGTTRWAGMDGSNGTTFEKDGQRIARLFPPSDPTSAAVIDAQGVALMRVRVMGDKAIVTDSATVPVRNLVKQEKSISVDAPIALTVTGTDDLVLAALLTAPELVPEVRMLAACERVLVKGT